MANPSNKLSAPIVTTPFLVAVVMLGAAALLAGPVSSRMNFKHAKLELKLKRPLTGLSESSLGPYRVVERQVLDPAVVEALGTQDYISWILEDTSVSPKDPLRYSSLMVTYYSGGVDLVPHTPDVCYLGAGYQPAQPHENIKLDVRVPQAKASSVAARLLTFAKTAVFDKQDMSVVYTFFCNGQFVDTGSLVSLRTGVRALINDMSNTYAYFSKIEAGFPMATRQQCVEGARKLFQYILPVLVRDHMPDFEAAEAEAKARAAAKG